MTLKQEIHELVDELPEGSRSLHEIRESLRLSKALTAAEEDVRNGRIYSAEEFMEKVRQRWPRVIQAGSA